MTTGTGKAQVPGSQQDSNPNSKVLQEYTAGAAHTKSVNGGIGVTGSDYDADKVTAGTSTREAIPSGATMVWVCNESITSTESVRFVFGDSTVVALATAGFKVSPGITTAVGDNGPTNLPVPVPPNATHWAYIAQAGTPTINVVWG